MTRNAGVAEPSRRRSRASVVGATCVACLGPTDVVRLIFDSAGMRVCGTCGHATTATARTRRGPNDYATSRDSLLEYERNYLPARRKTWSHAMRTLVTANARGLLDVGCNYGHFVEYATQAGWDAWGVEPGAHLRRHMLATARDRLFESMQQAVARAPYDLVTLWDVLEHLDDPLAMLDEVRGLLADDGMLLVRVPDARVLTRLSLEGARGLPGHAYLKLCHPTNPEEHVNHFTPRSLRTFANRSGFELVNVLDAMPDERVAAGRNWIDTRLRAKIHHGARKLPYEFTAFLAPGTVQAQL